MTEPRRSQPDSQRSPSTGSWCRHGHEVPAGRGAMRILQAMPLPPRATSPRGGTCGTTRSPSTPRRGTTRTGMSSRGCSARRRARWSDLEAPRRAKGLPRRPRVRSMRIGHRNPFQTSLCSAAPPGIVSGSLDARRDARCRVFFLFSPLLFVLSFRKTAATNVHSCRLEIG